MGIYKVKTPFTNNAEFSNLEEALDFAATALQSAFNLGTTAGRKMCSQYTNILDAAARNNPLRIDVHDYIHIIYEGEIEYQVIDEATGEILCRTISEKEAKEVCARNNWCAMGFNQYAKIRKVPKED